MFAFNILLLLNSANVSLSLSTNSESYAKMGNQESAGHKEVYTDNELRAKLGVTTLSSILYS